MAFFCRGFVLFYTVFFSVFVFVFVRYFYDCRCTDRSSPSSTPINTEEYGQSLTNVEALNEFLHRTNQLTKRAENVQSVPSNLNELPTIFIITPTYKRLTQKADLTRLCQTLMHVQKLEWIVIEDSVQKTKLVTNFLDDCTVSSVHLIEKTSENFTNVPIKMQDGKVYYGVKKPRGIEQRNKALNWIRKTYRHRNTKGTVFFGDDDNTYDLKIFREMRYIEKVAVWPVGLAGGLKYEGPKCSKDSVTGWYSYWATDRQFKIDFAGFAVSLELIMDTTFVIPLDSKPGYVEDAFLRQFVNVDDLEPKADSCTKVYVWHTRTEKPSMFYENQLERMGYPSSNMIEV